jgi:hypothetical protein
MGSLSSFATGVDAALMEYFASAAWIDPGRRSNKKTAPRMI